MFQALSTTWYIVLGILLFSLAIAIHEFGHFIVALRLGLKVERFSIGFGPAIWKMTWHGVEYRISWIPLGGYVSIPDVDPEGTKALEGAKGEEGAAPGEKIPPWKEILVAFAGPAMNIALAVVLALILSVVPSAKFGELPTVAGTVLPGEAADKAGIAKGDVIVSVGGHPVKTWYDLMTEIQFTGGKETEFVVHRPVSCPGAETVYETLSLPVSPTRDKVTGAYYAGILSVSGNGAKVWMPARNPLKQLAWDAGGIFRVLKALVTPKEAAATGKALSGPIMIARGLYTTLKNDVWDGVGLLRFLNVNLAVINLLPIPVLDGGLIMFSLIALIFRRRVPEKIVSAVTTVFMYLLLGLMAILIFKDSMLSYRLFRSDRAAAAKSASEQTSDSQ